MAAISTLRLGALAFVGLCAQPAPPEPSSPEFLERVATLNTSRSAHTATALRSGHVLIAGGMAGGGRLDGVELFDPSANTLQTLAPLAQRRSGHTATLLGDGRVLIAGGYDGDYLPSVEIFDPVQQQFHTVGALAEARSEHTATPMPDGRVLLIGGVGPGWTFLRSAELYDPMTGRSEPVGPMSVPREGHTATRLADGRVVVIGGHSGRRDDMVVYASAEVYVPAAKRFEPAGMLATPRHKHDAVRLRDGHVLVIGGADRTDRNHYRTTELFDPARGTFARGPSMRHARYKIAGTSVVLPNGDVLVASGARTAELLDDTGAFREIRGQLADAYRFAAAAPLPGGDVVIAGGYSDGNRNTDGVWRFRRP